MNEVKVFEREFGPESSPERQSEGGVNLWILLNDRMHGRWKWAIAAGLILGASLAVVGFRMAAVSYSARGLVQVESELPTLVMETPETASLQNFSAFIGSQAELMRDARVVSDALKSDQLQAHLTALGEDPQSTLIRGLSVSVIRGTNLIGVEFAAEDRRLAQAAVNAVIDAYFRIFGPNSETMHTRTMQQVRTLLTDSRRRLADLESERERVIRESEFGTFDTAGQLDAIVEQVGELQDQIERIDELRAAIEAIASAEDRPVDPLDVASPSDEDLAAADPGLPELIQSVEEERLALSLLRSRMSDQHPQVRQAINRYEASQAAVTARREELLTRWKEMMGSSLGYEALGVRRSELAEELGSLRGQIERDQRERSRIAAINRDVVAVSAEILRYEERLAGLETESETIRQGRVTIRAMAQLPTAPSKAGSAPASSRSSCLGRSIVGRLPPGSSRAIPPDSALSASSPTCLDLATPTRSACCWRTASIASATGSRFGVATESTALRSRSRVPSRETGRRRSPPRSPGPMRRPGIAP
jgi:uncharacterized protein involved in exopolysaccharide biosynthesis